MRQSLAAFASALLVAACGARSELRGGVSDGSSDGLIPDFVWYRLDETAGTTAHDSSSHHFDILVAGVTWGDGAIFDGGSVCGSTSVSSEFREPPLSITAWLTPDARDDETLDGYALTPFPPDAVSGDVPALGGYGIGLNVWTDGGGGRALAVETGAGANVAFHSEPGAFAAGVRHFVGLVVSTSGLARIYVDGAPFAEVSENVPPSASPTPLHLGCHNDDDGYGTKRFYKGRMRDVRIYKHALDAGAIESLFANGPV